MDKFTIGSTKASVNLMDILDQKGGTRKRKILNAFQEYSIQIKAIVESNVDSSVKKNLLRLVYEDRNKYFLSTKDIEEIKTHCMNVCQSKYGDAVNRVEFQEKLNLKQINFDYLVSQMKRYFNVK